ncbi:MAG: hypothetical protein P8X48_03270 [Acidiferrobacteraceae bacterium]|jgi:hypothetical protein
MYPGKHAQGYPVDADPWHPPGHRSLGNASRLAASRSRQSRLAPTEPQGTTPQPRILGREITVALLLKLILLFAIWLAFFSHPLDRKLGASDMDRLLLGNTIPPSLTHNRPAASGPDKEDRHDP